MPTMEMQEYDQFRYDEPTLTLDEAVKKASELRRKDHEHFYRIEPANDKITTFRVTKISSASVYADFLARVAKLATSAFALKRTPNE